MVKMSLKNPFPFNFIRNLTIGREFSFLLEIKNLTIWPKGDLKIKFPKEEKKRNFIIT